MRKYWAYFKVGIQNTIIYRGPMIFWLMGNVISVITMVMLWFSVDSGAVIAGYTKNELITYYIVSIFLSWVIGWYPFWIAKDIKTGYIIGQILLKPVSLYWRAFMGDLAWHAISIFFGLAASSVFLIILRDHFVFSLTVEKAFLMLSAMLLAIIVVFGFCVVVSMLAFWYTETSIFTDIFWVFLSILGGQTYPISFLPKELGILPMVLPFRYMFSFPIEIYFGKLSPDQIYHGFAVGIFWAIVISTTYKIVFRKGTKAYNAWGQ